MTTSNIYKLKPVTNPTESQQARIERILGDVAYGRQPSQFAASEALKAMRYTNPVDRIAAIAEHAIETGEPIELTGDDAAAMGAVLEMARQSEACKAESDREWRKWTAQEFGRVNHA